MSLTGCTAKGGETVHAVRVSDRDTFGKRGECGAWLSAVIQAPFNPKSAYACKLCLRSLARKDRK